MGNKLTSLVTNAKAGYKKNSPTILLCTGIFGMVATCVAASKASVRAHDILINTEEQRKREYIEAQKQAQGISTNMVMPPYAGLSVVDCVKLTWKEYIPTVFLGGASILCLIEGHRESLKREAALLGVYHLANERLHSYENKVEKLIGEAKNKEVKEEIAVEKAKNSDSTTSESLIIADSSTDGLMLWYDIPSKRYFRSTFSAIQAAENAINKRLKDEMSVSLNDFYDELGSKELEPTVLGDKNGWNVSNNWLNITYGSYLDNNRYAGSIDYDIEPLQSLYGDFRL